MMLQITKYWPTLLKTFTIKPTRTQNLKSKIANNHNYTPEQSRITLNTKTHYIQFLKKP